MAKGAVLQYQRRQVAPFVMMPEDLALERLLSDQAYRLYAVMLKFARGSNECYARQQTIAESIGWSVRKLRDVLLELQELQLVNVVYRTGTSNIYQLQNVIGYLDVLRQHVADPPGKHVADPPGKHVADDSYLLIHTKREKGVKNSLYESVPAAEPETVAEHRGYVVLERLRGWLAQSDSRAARLLQHLQVNGDCLEVKFLTAVDVPAAWLSETRLLFPEVSRIEVIQ